MQLGMQIPMLTYDKRSRNNLEISRECVRRIYSLGLAWRVTGKEIYAEKAKKNLRVAVLFSPVWEDGKLADPPDIVPLSEW